MVCNSPILLFDGNDMIKKNYLFSVCSILLLLCMYIYMMFWENRFVNSRVIYLSIAIFSMLVIFSMESYLDSQVVVFIIILIYNIVQLSFMNDKTDDSTKWIETIIIYAVILIALNNSFQNDGVNPVAVKLPLTVLSGIFVFGIYLQKLFPDYAERINRIFLSSDSIVSNHTFLRWGYYCGFSGLTFVSGLDCMIFGIFQLDKAMSKKTKKINKILCFVCVLLAIYGTILVQKRGLFVSILVCLSVYILLKAHNIKSLLASVLLIGVIGLICYYLLNNNDSGALFLWRVFGKDDMTSGRSAMRTALIEKSKEAIFTGHGPASVTALYSGDAHNIYIQVLYENGIIGLSLYLLFFGLNLKSTYICYKSGNSLAGIGLAVQIAILVYGVTGNPLTDIFVFLLYILASTIGFIKISSSEYQKTTTLIKYKYIRN